MAISVYSPILQQEPRFATQQWGCDFGGSITLGAMADDGAHNGVNFYNPLMTDNTLLAGDFSLATLYVWDDLMIEIAQIGNDKIDGKTTIMEVIMETY